MNRYQEALTKIVSRACEDIESLLAEARSSGHFPDDPGYTDEFGDPINREIARAERKLQEGHKALAGIAGHLYVEALDEPRISI